MPPNAKDKQLSMWTKSTSLSSAVSIVSSWFLFLCSKCR